LWQHSTRNTTAGLKRRCQELSGVDVTYMAIAIQKGRLREMFPSIQLQVIGEPTDIGAARACARKPLSIPVVGTLLGAGPLGGEADSERGKKGTDRGIDGVISFIDEPSGKSKRAIIQVKSGDVCDLRGTLEREQAAMGTLEPPSRGMRTGAAAAGVYSSPG
jgi:site-specific DNA-methyltransferase (adenine-specific)